MRACMTALLLALTAGAWAATTGVLNPVDFGADPTGVKDSAPAFAQLATAAQELRQVQVQIPPGRFRLAAPVTLQANGNQSNYGLTVQGAGEDATELVVDNTESGLQIVGANINRLSVTVRDLSLVAARPDSGTALGFTIPNPGDHHSRQLQLENILIRGERFNNGCFRYGVAVRNAWYPRFVNVKVTSSYGAETPAAPRALDTAFLLEDCYSPLLRDCYVWGGRFGLIHRAAKTQPEDGIIDGCYFVGNERCITVILKTDASAWEEPGFHISTCHVNYRDAGITLQGVRQANISHCLFYCSDRQGAAFYGGGKPREFEPVDVNLSYASDVLVDGNIFTEPSNPRRVAVRISKDSGDILVSGNQFNLEGVAVRNESALPSFCSGNYFGGRRDFSGGIRHYDDRTGTLKRTDIN
jgi:hypothetical protein